MKFNLTRLLLLSAMTFSSSAFAKQDLAQTDILGFKFGMTRDEIMSHANQVLPNARQGGYSNNQLQICFGEKSKRSKNSPCTLAKRMIFNFTAEGHMVAMQREDLLDTSDGEIPYGPYVQQVLDKYIPGKKYTDEPQLRKFNIMQIDKGALKFSLPLTVTTEWPLQYFECDTANVIQGISLYSPTAIDACGVFVGVEVGGDAANYQKFQRAESINIKAIHYPMLRQSILEKENAAKNLEAQKLEQLKNQPIKKYDL